MQAKATVVLFPTTAVGHLIPMVELAKLFVADGFSVTVVVVNDDRFSDTTERFISSVSSAHADISFHRLPKPTPSHPHPILARFETLRLASPHLLYYLKERKAGAADIRALVLDMFCTDALDVADELGVPSYFFVASSASTLAAFLVLPYLQSRLRGSFRDLGADFPILLPGMPPIRFDDLPEPVVDRGECNETMMFHMDRLWRAEGVIVNTFERLEKRAVGAMADGVIVPGRRAPPVYCVGPLVAEGSREGKECVAWLDEQPERSVALLCFGSLGSFRREQIGEIAAGLERSGVRFLWVLRGPHGETDVAELLPEGFLERTRPSGLVRSRVPQAAVLSHRAVGVFISHAGWNSALEAICAGVPMIVWPLYAEQRMNKVLLVEEAKLAVAMDGVYEGMVSAEEVERKIRWAMDSADASVMKARVAEAKEEAAAARKAAGSSTLAWLELTKHLRKDRNT